ncbi:hypothetical protein [Polaromonas sp. DSR2-3-2]|uniref:hypothetical protein n=1 Tax=unclassified Polaromonas TaxID=2638319 RepID=UPI003CF77B4A
MFKRSKPSANPQRWSGTTRNWQHVREVYLNPDQKHDQKEDRKEFKKAASIQDSQATTYMDASRQSRAICIVL